MTELPIAPRPRAVTIAFWCWIAAGVLLVALGMWQLALNIPIAFRAIGALLLAVGLGQGYLAGRAGKGDARFRRAALALAMLTVLLIVVLLMAFRAEVLQLAVVMALLVGGTVAIRSAAAQTWFDGESEQ